MRRLTSPQWPCRLATQNERRFMDDYADDRTARALESGPDPYDTHALKAFVESPLGQAAWNDAAARVTARFPNMGKPRVTPALDLAADSLLAALQASAALAPDTCEGSEGHLRDQAVTEARTDLEYIRTDPRSPLLALEGGTYLTIHGWLEEASALLKSWHSQS